jgi:hypothetical protein
MDNLDKQLNNLPKLRMSRRQDLRIRTRIFAMNFEQNLKIFFGSFNLTRLAYQSLAVIFVLALITSLPVYAYASKNVTADSPLYFLKRGVENLELIVSPDYTEIALHIKFADRRLAEAEVIAARPQDERTIDLRVQAVREAQDQVQKANVDIEKNEPESDKIEKEKIDINNKGIAEIKKIADDVTIDMRSETIQKVVSLIDRQAGDQKVTIPENTVPASDNADTSDRNDKEDIPAATSTDEKISSQADDSNANNFERSKEINKTGKNNRINKKVEAMKDHIKATSSKDKVLAKDRLAVLKNNYQILKATGTMITKENGKTDNLLDKLKDRIANAEKKFDEGKIEEANGMIETSETLQNFAKRLLGGKSELKDTDKIKDDDNEKNSIIIETGKESIKKATGTPAKLENKKRNDRNNQNQKDEKDQ